MSTPNVELLTRTLEHIKANQAGWSQQTWRILVKDDQDVATLGPTPCGTAMCFAGEVCELDPNRKWLITPEIIDKIRQNPYPTERLLNTRIADEAADLLWADESEWQAVRFSEHLQVFFGEESERLCDLLGLPADHDAWVIRAEYRATSLLGLSESEADRLFYGMNSLSAIEQIVEDIVDEVTP